MEVWSGWEAGSRRFPRVRGMGGDPPSWAGWAPGQYHLISSACLINPERRVYSSVSPMPAMCLELCQVLGTEQGTD